MSNPSPRTTGPSSARRTRNSQLLRLLDAGAVHCWLIDADGGVVFVSDPMRRWLGIENELPEAVLASLRPPEFARIGFDSAAPVASVNPVVDRAIGRDRGYQTCRIEVPTNEPDTPPVSAVAHFVRLRFADPVGSSACSPPSPTSPTLPPSTLSPDADSLTLGCLGDYVSDAEIPWQAWFGDTGIRDASIVAESIAKIRSRRSTRSTMLLAGTSTPSRQFRARIRLACAVRSHVGLIGPVGCGSSDLASLIHHGDPPRGPEPAEPFVCLDASLMDAELLEVYASPAVVPLSDSRDALTTLRLDRFDEMPMDGQERLVQFLNAFPRRLRLIGVLGEESDQSLSQKLKPELADAMSVLPITVPRLSDRWEDLPLISQSLVRTARLSREAIELIQTYPWPGEWDEMVAAMQFAGENARDDRITREHFPLAIRSFRVGQSPRVETVHSPSTITITRKPEPPESFQIESLDASVAAYESELIGKAMTAAGGNKAEAARRLGISRARLLRKLDSENGPAV